MQSISVEILRLAAVSMLVGASGATLWAQSTTYAASSAPLSIYSRPMEVFVGGHYSRGKLGPDLSSANLGGWNVSITDYMRPRIGVTADFQGTYGTQPLTSHTALATDPFVFQHSYFVGPQVRLMRTESYASSVRVLVGATTSVFDMDLNGRPPSDFRLYTNATKLAIKVGSTFDFNLKPYMALRIAPSTVIQRFNATWDDQFIIAAGLVFRFGKDHSTPRNRVNQTTP